MAPTLIPARSGAATVLEHGQMIRISNPHGQQVIDFWTLRLPGPDDAAPRSLEYMSMSHSRVQQNALRPFVGSTFVTNRRRPILTLTKDTSPGIHDTLIPSCDIYRYYQLVPGLEESGGYHDNCADNFHEAIARLAASGAEQQHAASIETINQQVKGWAPDPFNVFMSVPWASSKLGEIAWDAPVSRPGDYVEFTAECDALVVMSACPQDVTSVNGGKTLSAEYEVFP